MSRDPRPASRTLPFQLVASVSLLLFALAAAFAVSATERARLTPKFLPGQTLRYQIDTRTTSTGKTTLPIVNPEGGVSSSQAIHLLVRFEVLPAQAASAAITATAALRFRATYENSNAESQSDAYDPNASSLADQYARLEGRSVEFTIDAAGNTSNLRGVDPVSQEGFAAAVTLPWFQALASGNGVPRDGIAIGQKWTAEHPLAGAPIAGLVWRTQSTYLRNEPCPESPASAAIVAPAPAPASSPTPATRPAASLPPQTSSANSASARSASGAKDAKEMCAVVLTHFEIARLGSPHAESTPEDYLHNGLRSSGSWTGSGQSLDSISLATGILVSSTQTSTQDTDYQITSAASGSTLHHTGRTESHSEITLLPLDTRLPPLSQK